MSVFAGIICDASNHPLTIQQVVIEFRYRTHMDAAKHERCAFFKSIKSGRHDLAGRGEYNGRVEPYRRFGECITNPLCPKFLRERLVFLAIACCNIDLGST